MACEPAPDLIFLILEKKITSPCEPCYRCGGQPVAEKIRSFWRAVCPSHQGISTNVFGHTMKTRKAALAEWDIAMRAYEADTFKTLAESS